MPIPRRVQNEFFISGYKELLHEDSRNEAVIYQPVDYTYAQSIGIGREIENLEDFITHINNIFSNATRIDLSHLQHTELYVLLNNIIIDMFLSDYLRNFLVSSRSDNIVSLAYDLYRDLRDNSTLRNVLGRNRINTLQRNVFKYYKVLLSQNKEEQKPKKPNFNIQFKEFRVHQNYFEMKKYKEIKNINVKKYQHYLRCLMRKNRNKVFCNHFVFNCFWYNTKTIIRKN